MSVDRNKICCLFVYFKRTNVTLHLFDVCQRGVFRLMNDTAFIERNRQVVEEFRANGGKVGGQEGVLLLTIKGAKSGLERVYPLITVSYGDSYLAVASKGGAPKNPAWYHNLLANPDVTVEVGTEKFPATARLLSGEERAKAFTRSSEVFPNYAEYQKNTDREIPVFIIERKS
jgi:F420H(2)-dependent quinone reductase